MARPSPSGAGSQRSGSARRRVKVSWNCGEAKNSAEARLGMEKDGKMDRKTWEIHGKPYIFDVENLRK
jgi:hypothetical protein